MRLDRLGRFALEHRSLPVMIGLIVVFSALAPRFATQGNFSNILLQSSVDGIMAIGMAVALIGGQFDLSIGAIMVLAAFIAVDLSPYGPLVSILGATAFGCGAGVLNGLLVTKAKVNAFIATLGMLFVIRGVMLTYSHGFPKSTIDDAFLGIASSEVAGIPLPVVFFLLTAISAHLLMSRTQLGMNVRALGSNAEFCRLAGLRIDRYRIALFVGTGATAGFSGAILASRLGSASPTLGVDTPLIVISAVILGGVSLYGGLGSIPQAVAGILTLGILSNGLNLMGVSPYYRYLVLGGILILVVVLDASIRAPGALPVLRAFRARAAPEGGG